MAKPISLPGVPALFTTGDDLVWLGKKGALVSALAGNDTVSGGDGNDTINGDQGDDKLLGGGGDDALHGGPGNDLLLGGLGHNSLEGGLGIDTADYSWYTGNQPVFVNLALRYAVDAPGASPAAGTGQSFNDELNGIENVIGARNVSNTIIGDEKANLLIGGNFADTLDGGQGNDTLTGGTGADIFRYEFDANNYLGVDHITDFDIGVDKIGLVNPFRYGGFGATTNWDAETQELTMSFDVFAEQRVLFTVVIEGIDSEEMAYISTRGPSPLTLLTELFL